MSNVESRPTLCGSPRLSFTIVEVLSSKTFIWWPASGNIFRTLRCVGCKVPSITKEVLEWGQLPGSISRFPGMASFPTPSRGEWRFRIMRPLTAMQALVIAKDSQVT